MSKALAKRSNIVCQTFEICFSSNVQMFDHVTKQMQDIQNLLQHVFEKSTKHIGMTQAKKLHRSKTLEYFD